MSMTAMKFSRGKSPAIKVAGRDQVLFAKSGTARLTIGDRVFEISDGTGAYIRAGEAFSITNTSEQELVLLDGICPQADKIAFGAEPGEFDNTNEDRLVVADQQALAATGDRYYKLLVGPSVGSNEVTQFIGMIPQSHAPEHFHTYEETICILAGEGFMWTGDKKAAVRPGSLIYLPLKQNHCLECTSPDGMTLMGLFYPAGSPAVSYE